MKNESNRTKKYYTKEAKLTKEEAKKFRRKLRDKQGLNRLRKKEMSNSAVSSSSSPNTVASTSQDYNDKQKNEVSSSDSRMLVRLQFGKTQKQSEGKKQKRSDKKLKNKIEYLRAVRKDLERKNQTLRKRLSRLQRKESNVSNKIPKTPRSKSEHELREAGSNPKTSSQIKRKLIFANCLANQMKRSNKKGCNLIKLVVASTILRKYKMTQFAANLVGSCIRQKERASRQETESKKRSQKLKNF